MMGRLTPPVSERDHVMGAAEARVTLVEYGDYECSYCGEAYTIIQAVRQRLGGQVRFVFRNFPLSELHPHARLAAYAAEAAAMQGRFWEMHDLLYENQESLEPDDLIGYAELLGLDVEQFDRDAGSRAVAERVRSDCLGGSRAGVSGTPTFFINGQRYDGNWAVRPLFGALEAAIAEADSQEQWR
ncbi:DsbA family protein [Archangium violaceum]|uniref:DsbA family protein n=1 Tax=Archangium violaceum TaxID=83451 RepID=UPI00194DCB38|nr:thioredoxin domain-containing protein [Archangium violaceum]QRN93641.1 DsbA family protein [Archangium violaceum]